MFNYNPFWQTLKNKNISQYKLINDYHISSGTLDDLRKNKSITVYTLHKLCLILDCTPNDILEIKPDELEKE